MLNQKIKTSKSQTREMRSESTNEAARAIIQAELDQRDARIETLKAARIEKETRNVIFGRESRGAALLRQNAQAAPKLKGASARSRGR